MWLVDLHPKKEKKKKTTLLPLTKFSILSDHARRPGEHEVRDGLVGRLPLLEERLGYNHEQCGHVLRIQKVAILHDIDQATH